MTGGRSKPRTLALTVQYATRRRRVPDRRQFRSWVRRTIPVPAEITIRLVDEPEGRRINQQFRNRDYATNVLSFAYHDDPSRSVHGDIVLCAPVIAREARERGRPAILYYAHLTVHGLLHLLGYEHESAPQARAMQAQEATTLASLGYPDSYR